MPDRDSPADDTARPSPTVHQAAEGYAFTCLTAAWAGRSCTDAAASLRGLLGRLLGGRPFVGEYVPGGSTPGS
ncbi:hypothetical protein [Streptomyces tropicalis]|uniref:Uncharacterized protein n=1 Tax=Streptomyces tropicalis TaxID=3034234 RepID=A0ABT5ZYM5_9ACTN|nr:hypothetical protein [Streptomyces tropicalis]MDF3297495.1 hypothetical protein [Streptomyces tropicalis]